MTYNLIKQFLAQGRNKSSRKLENNTYAEVRGDAFAVRLHDTDVLTFHQNGDVVYNSGGWTTVTTKDRLNGYGLDDVSISQSKKIWYIETPCGMLPFKDGVTVNEHTGTVTGAGSKANVENTKALSKAVNSFAGKFVNAFFRGEVEPPSGGDCWFCSFHNEDGETWGDRTADKGDHLLQHINENYFVPSLLYNALTEYSSQLTKAVTQEIWDVKSGDGQINADIFAHLTEHFRSGWGYNHAYDMIKKSVKRYVSRRLGLA